MPDVDYDKLMQIEDWTTNEQSPFYKSLMQALEPHSQKLHSKAEGLQRAQGGKLTKEQNAELFKEYQSTGAAKTLEMIQQAFGGKIPDQKEAQEYDYGRRVKQLMASPDFKGTEEEANATIRDPKQPPPYSHAYSVLSNLQALLPKQAAQQPPAQPPAPAARMKPQVADDAPDEAKLSDSALMMLMDIARGGGLPPTGATGPAGATSY